MLKRLIGKWALVTGASSGLGAEFARILAKEGANLILVARREARLEEVAAEIRKQYSVEIEVLKADLGSRKGCEDFEHIVGMKGLRVDVLINNAGFGVYGPFLEIPWKKELAMLELDVISVVHLTKLFAPRMVKQKEGWILQVASIGAFQPCPTYASYAAAKSFVLSFGEAINYELQDTGVSCTVLSPGITRTEFLEVSGQDASFYQRMMMMESSKVCQVGIDAMLDRKPSVVPGLLNKLSAFSIRFLPRKAVTALAGRMMR